ncbi:redoxin domain-containing protein [Mesobacillus foraminis]|uniref:DsbE subfamily thiol:disulfide oxidoreductase n=1 Tax=Mesobacillus foraminis TaxID=279826 RepID=A0A4R2BG01_9BACI|nr:redoxin domain-containing protein [Mesobacillus foraminis]TCN25957.1 DsbE subfamily thiol:disulfide oxidoreductase [Mesobacillus foraminis]
MKRGLLLIIVFTALIFAATPGMTQKWNMGAFPSAKAAGIQAPEFSLKNLQNETIQLSQYKGKKVLINFWATWCPPCKAEMPVMQDLYERNMDKIEFLAINIDPENNVKSYVKKMELTFPILLDKSGTINEQYGIISIPTTFLVDENGNIIKKQIGAMNAEQMQEFINTP